MILECVEGDLSLAAPDWRVKQVHETYIVESMRIPLSLNFVFGSATTPLVVAGRLLGFGPRKKQAC